MFSELLARLPDIELATDEALPYRASNFIVGPEAMPIRFTPTPVVAGQAGSGPGVQPAPPSA